jgi:hypothetical protein
VSRQRTFVGLDVHARSVVGHAVDESTGQVPGSCCQRIRRHLELVDPAIASALQKHHK